MQSIATEGRPIYIELTTGHDSFRAQGASGKRNVTVTAFVRVKDDGEGRTVIPLFAAYQKKLKGFRNKSLLSVIPATSEFAPNAAGEWFKNRYEVQIGTEILLEYRRRETKGFGEAIEYMLIKTDENAPLWQLRLELPHHHISNVPNVFFDGRFELINDDTQLPEHSVGAWKDYLGLDDEFKLSDILDTNAEDGENVFIPIQLEQRTIKKRKTTIVEDAKGSKRIKIRRTRNIKTR